MPARPGRPAGSTDRDAVQYGFLLGVVSAGNEGPPARSKRWGPYPGGANVSAWAREKVRALAGSGYQNGGLTTLANTSVASTIQSGPL